MSRMMTTSHAMVFRHPWAQIGLTSYLQTHSTLAGGIVIFSNSGQRMQHWPFSTIVVNANIFITIIVSGNIFIILFVSVNICITIVVSTNIFITKVQVSLLQ